MDHDLVADHVASLCANDDEGGFLLARVITSQLRDHPVDTSQPDWQDHLSRSVEEAFDRDLRQLAGTAPCGLPAPDAARHLLEALAWGYGSGLPDGEWAAVAGALDPVAAITRDDVYWVLDHLGRYVVASRQAVSASFRLSHQRLVSHVRPTRSGLDGDEVAYRIADALTRRYRAALAAGAQPTDVDYPWLYLWAHCVEAGVRGIALLRDIAASNPAFLNDLAMSLHSLGIRYSEVGRRVEAVAPTEEAVTIYRGLAASNPAFLNDLAMSLNNLGIRYSGVGRRGEAVAPTEEAVTIYRGLAASNPAFLNDLAGSLSNLGVFYSEVGRRAEAVAPTEEAVTIRRELAASNPAFLNDLAMSLNNLGIRYSEVGRRAEAVAPTEEAVTIYRELAASNPAFLNDLAMSLNNLGAFYSEVGRRAEAVAPTEEAVTIRRELAASNPAFLNDLAGSLNNLGIRYSGVGRRVEAVAPTEEAVTIYRELAASNPAFLNDLAMSLSNLGGFYNGVGRRGEAVAPTEEAVTIYRGLAASNPAFLNDLASSLNNLGAFYNGVGRRGESVAPTEEAVTIRRGLAASNPAFLNDLAGSLNNLGVRYSEVGRRAEAVAPTEEAVTIRRGLAASNPAFLNDLAMSLSNLGGFYNGVGRRAEAVAPTEEAVTIRRELAASNPAFLNDLASSLNNLGIRYSGVGRRGEAVAPTEEAVTVYRELAASNPAFLNDLAMSLSNLGGAYYGVGRRGEAVAPTEEAVTIYRGLAASNPAFLNDLAGSLSNLGVFYSEVGRRAEAVASTEEAVTIRRELAASNPAFLNDLASSLNNLGDRYSEVGRTLPNQAWEHAIEATDEYGAAFLLIRRALFAKPGSDAVDDLVSARPYAEASGLTGMLHDAARSARQASRSFDERWQAATGELPEWLTVELEHYQLVVDWLQTPTFAAEADFARQHASALLSGPTDLVLDEVQLVDGQSRERERAVLAATREHGIDAAYEPLVAAERIAGFLDQSPDGQLNLIIEHRELYVTRAAQDALQELTTEADGGFGAALLQLAADGRDSELIGVLTADEPQTESLVIDIVAHDEPGVVSALGRALMYTVDPVTGLFVIALSFCLAGHTDEAAETVLKARRYDDAAVQRLLPLLVRLTAVRPELAFLAEPCVAALPDSNDDPELDDAPADE